MVSITPPLITKLFWPKKVVRRFRFRFVIMPPKGTGLFILPKEKRGEPYYLASMLEEDKTIRTRLIAENRFTRWLKPEAVGIKSVKAMTLNSTALEIVAKWWCPQFTHTTALRIGMVRPQVLWLRKCVLPQNWEAHRIRL